VDNRFGLYHRLRRSLRLRSGLILPTATLARVALLIVASSSTTLLRTMPATTTSTPLGPEFTIIPEIPTATAVATPLIPTPLIPRTTPALPVPPIRRPVRRTFSRTLNRPIRPTVSTP
jgi:hypothetical protein